VNARNVAGWTALVSGALLVVGIVVAALAAPGTSVTATAMGPGMMGGGGMIGPAMMGPGMMGGGYAGGMGMMHGWGPSTGTSTTRPGVAQVTVRALNFAFEPNEIRLPKDAEVDLTLVNSTSVVHDVTVPALGIQLVAPAGTTRTLALSRLPAGRYVGYCSVPGHAELGMRVTVIVE
jgi:heme/copper-type cytochrome/quinol oxidase subunit 2